MRVALLSFLVWFVGMVLGVCDLVAADELPDEPNGKSSISATSNPGINPPGARALGMGATFIGISDDATAAESNPAGLVILTQPEFSVTYRTSSVESKAVHPYQGFFDRTKSFEESTAGPSFISYTRPWPAKKAAFSVYYQQASNFRSQDDFVADQFIESFNRLELLLEHVGISAAVQVSSRVSIGLSARYSRLDMDLTNRISDFVVDRLDPFFAGHPIYDGLTSPLFDRFEFLAERVDDSDGKLTANAGILINPGGKVSLGAVYKRGADFTLDTSIDYGFLFPRLEPGNTPDNFPSIPIDGLKFLIPSAPRATYTIPDAFGVGFAYRPNSNWILGLDVIRVRYSDTESRFADLTADGDRISPSDETEIHLGLEYGFTLGANNTPFFVRAGYYNNPDHDASSLIDSEQNFVTLGAGVFLKEKLQLDAALAISEDVTDALVSMVWRL